MLHGDHTVRFAIDVKHRDRQGRTVTAVQPLRGFWVLPFVGTVGIKVEGQPIPTGRMYQGLSVGDDFTTVLEREPETSIALLPMPKLERAAAEQRVAELADGNVL